MWWRHVRQACPVMLVATFPYAVDKLLKVCKNQYIPIVSSQESCLTNGEYVSAFLAVNAS